MNIPFSLSCAFPILLLSAVPAQTTATARTSVKLAVPAADAVQDPVPATRDANQFVLTVGEHSLEDLITASGQFLKMNFLVNAMEMQARPQLPVVITHPVKLDQDSCFDTLSSILFSNGFGILPMDPEKGMYEVVSLMGSRRGEFGAKAAFVPFDRVGQYEKRYLPIITSMPLEHLNATVATNTLRPFFAQGGGPAGTSLNIGNVGNQRSLLLQGFGPQVVAAVQLIKLTDVPPARNDAQDDALAALTKRVKALEKALADKNAEGKKVR